MCADSVQLAMFEDLQPEFCRWLVDAVSMLHAAPTLSSCLEQFLCQLEVIADYDAASVAFVEGDQFVAAATRMALGHDPADDPCCCQLDAHPYLQALQGSSRAIVGQSIVEDEAWTCLPGVAGCQSWLLCPLSVDDQLIGQLTLAKQDADAYGPQVAAELEALAKQAALALRNVQVRQVAVERAARLEAQSYQLRTMLETLRELSADLSLQTLFQRVADKAIQIIPDVDAGLVFVLEGSAFVCRGVAGLPPEAYAGLSVPAVALLGEWTTLVVKGTGIDPWQGALPHALAQALAQGDGSTWDSVSSTLLLPMQVTDEMLGMVVLCRLRSTEPFAETTVESARLFSAQSAVSMANARLYHMVREYASTLESTVARRTGEIREEQERTEAILRSVADGVIVTDLEGNIIEANPVAREWLEMTVADQVYHNIRLQGFIRQLALQPQQPSPSLVEFPVQVATQMSCRDYTSCQQEDCPFFGTDSGPCWAQHLAAEGLVDLGPRDCETCPRYLELPKIALQARAAPISHGDGDAEAVGTVIVLRDISRLKELDRLKSQFVSNVSHELRTPLSNIKLYLSLLKRGREQKRSHYLKILDDETSRLSTLIEDLLDLSRLEAGQSHPSRQWQRWRAIAEQVLDTWQPQLVNKRLRLVQEWDERETPVLADRNQLIQVFTNLLSNAINYTQPGGWIRVRTTSLERNGRRWCALAVSDNGIGISPADQEHVFDRFFRGGAEGLGIPGTGLGLTIVKEIVQLYGGHIEIESEVGVGSSFIVYLPSVAAPGPA